MKLSSRLCLTHKRVKQKYRNSTLIKKKKKKNCARIGSESADTQNFLDRIGSEKNAIVASLIVTTHWWPKTRNERFVWENEQYLYSFFLPLVHNHVQVIWVHTHPVCASTLDGGRVWSVVLTPTFQVPIRSPHANTQSRSCNTREVCDWLL